MPHVDIRAAKRVTAQKKNELQREIGESMHLIPGKTIANTVIAISGDHSLFKNGEPLDGAFVDVRLFKNSPDESKKIFSEKVFSIIETVLEIPPGNVQINFVELPNWASGGSFLQ